MAHADTVNTALDVLYAADLDAFTSTRTELAQRVRDEAGKDAADAVARARKPTVPAWALNRVVRERAEEARALADAAERLRGLQAQLVEGKRPKGVDEAVADVRSCVAALARAAGEEAGEAGRPLSAPASERVFETLLASVADANTTDELLHGRLTKELKPAGFGFAGDVSLAPAGVTKRGAGAKADREAERRRRREAQERKRRAERAVVAARKELAAAQAARREADAALRKASQAEEKARKRLADAEDAARAARDDV